MKKSGKAGIGRLGPAVAPNIAKADAMGARQASGVTVPAPKTNFAGTSQASKVAKFPNGGSSKVGKLSRPKTKMK